MSVALIIARLSSRNSVSQIKFTKARQAVVYAMAMLMLMVAGNVYAATSVKLSIKNKAGNDGKISVVEGKKVKVKYKIIEDTEKLLSKKDLIQLVRVRDNKVVASKKRGKKKSGTVSLKAKKSAGEQLYVRYVRKKGGQVVSRLSHPSDAGFVPLQAIAKVKTKPEDKKKQLQAGQIASQTQTQASSKSVTKIKSFDVIGVSLGMNISQAEQVLKSKYPGFHVVPINYKSYGQQWTGIMAAMPKTKHKDEVVLVDFNQPPLEDKVIAITRYKEFPANATPSLENLENSLLKKYGKWTQADATTRAGYRKIYNWRSSQRQCIGEKLYASFGRLREIVDEGTLSRVLGDAYGDPSQYIKGFREHAELNTQTPTCQKQITVEVHYRPDQNLSPVNKLIVVVADFPAYFNSEVAYSKMADAYLKQKSADAVQKGGEPEL